MRTLLLLVVSLFVLGACDRPAGEADEQTSSSIAPTFYFEDLDVHNVYAYMIIAIGTEDAWHSARYLEFDFKVRMDEGADFVRSHRWDKWEGKARVQWTDDGGETVVVIDGMDPLQGRAWVAGTPVTDEAATSELVERAYRAHINDSYWLVMPYKWRDPGVNVRWLGRELADDGREFDVLELTFEGVGVTPDNKYHAYVNRENWLMERWAHFPTRDAEPSFAEWGDWRDVGPLVLSLDKGRVYFENVRVLQGDPPAEAFAPPA